MSSSFVKEVYEWIKSLVIAGILAYLIHTFLFAIVVVSGSSMEPTLLNQERLIMNKIAYRVGAPQHGDIVVFHATETDDYIKRVIGLPGDIIEFKEDTLYINGESAEEVYLNEKKNALHEELTLTIDFGPVEVPDGMVFVMGDNRRNSTDSRDIGPIEIEKIIGRVKIVIWPIQEIRSLN